MYDPTITPTNKVLCQMASDGINPTDTSSGSDGNLEISIPSDRYGAFIRPGDYGVYNSVSSSGVELKINYSTCGFDDTDAVNVSVSGIEMVYIPQGAFYAGDFAVSTASLTSGSADNDPWAITNKNAISVSNISVDGYRYVSAGLPNEDATGVSFSIGESFPKGFTGFYLMKYELTEGQWVEFVNSLGSHAARTSRDLTNAAHKNSDAVVARNTISCSGNPLICSTSRPWRPVSYLTWMDLTAFLDWAALRPMTELEFEKAARGPILPKKGEFAWGDTSVTAAAVISGSNENGTEVITTSGANAHYGNISLTGGDSGQGANYAVGPVRNGIFATNSSNRVSSGASYYGVMELSGNLSELTVSIGNSNGRDFSGTHGDGDLTTTIGYEGNANTANWPGFNADISRGITQGDGSGIRGGSWSDVSSAALRISDRSQATLSSSSAANNIGGRGARSYE
ncbi:MAG: SUMF1/EgtB/PvdO family nonheme iron enzyme [Candidatus Omnitrophica bacterium]|nr:SUMF1/EgtB/PvdO family nonheme iron enzyme [Candidatus Omnitrophota bacterium]